MRILYLHQYFNTPKMTGGTRSYEMARRLVESGHEVHLITSRNSIDGKNNDIRITNEDGIIVHWLSVPYSNNMSYLRRIISFLHFVLLSAKECNQLQADLVFATSTPLTISIPGFFASRKLKVPFVFEVRDLWPELPIAMGALKNPISKWLAKKLEKWSYEISSEIIALSPGMKSGILEAGVCEKKIHVVPNGSDNSKFLLDKRSANKFKSSRNWLGDRPLVLYAGTLGKINGVDYFVDLAKEVAKLNKDIRFLVVGEGAEKWNVKNKAKSLGIFEKNFFMENGMSKDDMPELFAAADISCSLFIDLPQMRANSANKFFDTLAAGKPILINYGGWHHDLIKERDCGISLWGMSIKDSAHEICEKISDKKWLEKSGVNARKIAEEDFDRDLLYRKFEKVLLKALTEYDKKDF